MTATVRRPGVRRYGTSGVTLIELMFALFLVGFVTVAAGFIYLTNERSFRQGREKLLLQQNLTFCVEQMGRDLREAWRVDHINGSRIILYDVNGNLTSTWELGSVGGENKVLRNGVSVVPEECILMIFNVLNADTSSIGVVLELRDDNDNRIRIGNTFKLRNHEMAGPS